MNLIKIAKELAMTVALRAAIQLLTFIGAQLVLSEPERRAVLGRIEAALLGQAASGDLP